MLMALCGYQGQPKESYMCFPLGSMCVCVCVCLCVCVWCVCVCGVCVCGVCVCVCVRVCRTTHVMISTRDFCPERECYFHRHS